MRYKIIIEYDGKCFCGWQKQKNNISVQGVLENALCVLLKHNIDLFAAGRTDSGVHALGQVAHFDTNICLDCITFIDKVNAIVRPHLVSIVSMQPVSEDFHARFSAKKRYYQYTIINRRAPVVFEARYSWQIYKELDILSMKKGISYFIGTYDFNAFRSIQCSANNTIRTIDNAKIICNKSKILFYFISRSFLHQQIRIMIGTLVMIGMGKFNPVDITKIMQTKDRKNAGFTAPAAGLCFMKVVY